MTPIPSYTSFLHPLETGFPERRRQTSISSDISDQDFEPVKKCSSNSNNWNHLLSQFDSQPDLIKLIQSCKEEEEKRCREENKMKLKEYQVWRQLQYIQEKKMASNYHQDFNLQLPPLALYK